MEGEFKDYPTVKTEQVSVYITKHSATSEKKNGNPTAQWE